MSAITTSVGNPQKRDWPKHLIIWAILAVELLPFYMMVQISFKDNTIFLENTWLPSSPLTWIWENYWFAVKLVLPYVANTVVVAVTGTIGTLTCSLMGAYFFARYKMPFSNILWSAFILLMLLPGVANIVPLFALLKQLNLLNTLYALIILGIAGGQVFCLFVLRNFIEDIPRDLFEAAEIDGASHFQQLLNVVIPMSGSIIGTLAILQFLGSWNDFLMPLIVLRDPELFTIGVGLIYLDGEYVKQWGKIMAAFFVASLPLIIIFLFTMKLFVRGLSSGALKG
jgi:ABC-type glycerol-3-phosphate transport system permease component